MSEKIISIITSILEDKFTPIIISILGIVIAFLGAAYAMFKGRYDQITGVKPALVFVYDRKSGWQLQNIGSGPALSIVVAKKEGGLRSKSGQWIQPVRVPPLKKDGSFSLHWMSHDNDHGFGATYEDMWGRRYTSTCGRDLNTIRRGHRLPAWPESKITAEWALQG